MKIVIFGGSGFIGSHLVPYLTAKGCEVILVSRSERQTNDPLIHCVTLKELDENADKLEQTDAFVNLAGETINQYWSHKAKEKILESRIVITKKVAEIVQKLKHKPKVVVNGSAVGIYGMSKTQIFDETSPQQTNDFLAHVVSEWEKAADVIQPHTRLVKLRTGVVLEKDGGALPRMLLPYKLYAGGRIGSGSQWLSWIHMEDLVRLIDFCINNENIHGPINATAPNPVTNDTFGRTLAKELRRPHYFPVPAFMLKIMFGEMSQMLLNGQQVLPQIARNHGFNFKYPTIEKAVKAVLQ